MFPFTTFSTGARRAAATLVATLVATIAIGAPLAAQSAIEQPAYPAPAHEKQAKSVEKHLKVFDILDFDVFSNQKWDRLGESHAADIIVTWPDGHETKGIERHIADLKEMFVYAPDITIKVHPVRFGSGSFTTATGVMTGTFSKPMPIGGGKFIEPTGKRFAITMATIGHWSKGTMDHEWLFWDSGDFMRQLGLAK